MKELTGIQVYYDPYDDYTPPFYAVDCDAIWERFRHVKFTADEMCCLEDLVEQKYGMLHRHRMIGHGWSEKQAIANLKSLMQNPAQL